VAFDYTGFLYFGDTRVAEASFSLAAGEEKQVLFPVTIPSVTGTYPVLLYVYSGGQGIALYRATEDVVILAPAAAFYWLLPTGYVDPSNKWKNEPLAYDGLTDTYAETSVGASTWGAYLIFTIPPTSVSAVRWWGSFAVSPHTIEVDVYYGGSWHNVYTGSSVILWDNGMALPDGTQMVSQARIRAYNPILIVYGLAITFRVKEFQFYGYSEVPPPPPPPPVTTKLFGYVTDSITGAPIVGAVGTVYQDYDTNTKSYDFTTDSSGYYLIDNMFYDADVTMMALYATGYQTYANEHVSIGKGDNQLNIRMARG
jgi:hypothetical protein